MQALMLGETGSGPAAVRSVLSERGYRLTSTASPIDALSAFRESPADLVVVNWKSYPNHAASFCRRLRAEHGDRIALLGLVEPDSSDLDDALSAGVSDYLTQPFSEPAVSARIAIVERWLEHIDVLQRKVSEQADAQQSASRCEEDFRVLMEACPDPIGIHRHRVLLYANSALAEALGYAKASDLVGVRLDRIVHPDEREVVEERLRTIEQTGAPVPVREERFLRRDGSIRVAEAHSFMIHWDGTPALVSVGKDLTERKELEAQLLHSERLASIGTLAAGVAHELNNPLTLVLCNLSDLGRILPSMRPNRNDNKIDHLEGRVRAIEDGIMQVRTLARDLTEFARGGDVPRQALDLRPIIERSVRMLGAHVRERGVSPIEVELEDVGAVYGNETQVTQLVLNLVLNAVDALDELPPGEPRCVTIRLSLDANQVVLCVSDTGPGIARELRERVFEPFFSTKPAGHGTGLGLTVTRTIVEQLQGTIRVVDSQKGSCFEVRLPALRNSSIPGPNGANS